MNAARPGTRGCCSARTVGRVGAGSADEASTHSLCRRRAPPCCPDPREHRGRCVRRVCGAARPAPLPGLRPSSWLPEGRGGRQPSLPKPWAAKSLCWGCRCAHVGVSHEWCVALGGLSRRAPWTQPSVPGSLQASAREGRSFPQNRGTMGVPSPSAARDDPATGRSTRDPGAVPPPPSRVGR